MILGRVASGEGVQQHRVDVCIFGCGPAGLAVASRLLDKGHEVAILDRQLLQKPWGGESFTGAIRSPLLAMGCWGRFEAAGHVLGYERESSWGGELQAETSMLRPSGPLWHVDRSRFDDDLRSSLLQRHDVLFTYRRLDSLTRDADEWCANLDRTTVVRARYLVDATGRSRTVARRLGATITSHDRLLGLASNVSRSESSIVVRSMLIQATPFGWWYAAPTPNGYVVAVFTDSDLAPREARRTLRSVPANSAFTDFEPEQGWLPVGDACASHDPLCGWGVHRALTNGLRAADAIDFYLTHHDSSQLLSYRDHCSQQYRDYLSGLRTRYLIEQRWPNALFWQRRHRLAA